LDHLTKYSVRENSKQLALEFVEVINNLQKEPPTITKILCELKKKDTVLTSQLVVEHFISQIPKDERVYYFIADSYYGSYNLAVNIEHTGHKFIFLCKSDRPGPLWKLLKEKGVIKREWKSVYHPKYPGIVATMFQDNAAVHVLTNALSDKRVSIESKGYKTSYGQPIVMVKPVHLARLYNPYMGGVDRFDRFVSEHKLLPHRTTKWTRCILLGIFKFAIVNSYIAFKIHHNRKDKNISFVQFMINALKEYRNMNYPYWKGAKQNPANLHILVKANGNKLEYCECCRQGINKKNNVVYSKTPYYCCSCRIYLHAPCFMKYHSYQHRQFLDSKRAKN
jgi:hypothetical protein